MLTCCWPLGDDAAWPPASSTGAGRCGGATRPQVNVLLVGWTCPEAGERALGRVDAVLAGVHWHGSAFIPVRWRLPAPERVHLNPARRAGTSPGVPWSRPPEPPGQPDARAHRQSRRGPASPGTSCRERLVGGGGGPGPDAPQGEPAPTTVIGTARTARTAVLHAHTAGRAIPAIVRTACPEGEHAERTARQPGALTPTRTHQPAQTGARRAPPFSRRTSTVLTANKYRSHDKQVPFSRAISTVLANREGWVSVGGPPRG